MSLNIQFLEYSTLKDGLSSELVGLLNLAEENLKNAYAPYSKFRVSVVCKMANDELVFGTNQENAAYPSGLCAERVAIFAAKSKFPNIDIISITITTEQSNPTPFSPCGACRQSISEYENNQNKPIQIILKSGDSKIWIFKSIADLLPFSFNGDSLVQKG